MTQKICMHYYVSGRVQGVFFRAYTQSRATSLGVVGFVRNLSDGRVEVMAVGTALQLEAFSLWLQSGPPQARVEGVTQEIVALQEFEGFEVL